jgi:hypothetical protein
VVLDKLPTHAILAGQVSRRLNLPSPICCQKSRPPPWTVEETQPCFIVSDHTGQALAFVYFEDEPGRRAAASLLTRDEARRIAAGIARLRELLRAEQPDAMRWFRGDEDGGLLQACKMLRLREEI